MYVLVSLFCHHFFSFHQINLLEKVKDDYSMERTSTIFLFQIDSGCGKCSCVIASDALPGSRMVYRKVEIFFLII